MTEKANKFRTPKKAKAGGKKVWGTTAGKRVFVKSGNDHATLANHAKTRRKEQVETTKAGHSGSKLNKPTHRMFGGKGSGAGYMPGLAKHLQKQLGGDPHFFSKCMDAPELKDYDTDARAGICALAHKMDIGHWPAEDKKLESKEKQTKESPQSQAPANMAPSQFFFDWYMSKDGKMVPTTKETNEKFVTDPIGRIESGNLAVFKEKKTGKLRWVLTSSNAFKDRDDEIVSTKALEDDVARADQDHDYGPLRWWHVSDPPLDIGDTDFNMLQGKMLIESGTFRNEAVGRAVKESADQLEVSLGYYHPASEPDGDGVFHHIRRFERSLLPKGIASNLYTALTVKGKGVDDMATRKEKEDTFRRLLGDDALADEILKNANSTEKSALASGATFKEVSKKSKYKPADDDEETEDPEEEGAETPEEENAEESAEETLKPSGSGLDCAKRESEGTSVSFEVEAEKPALILGWSDSSSLNRPTNSLMVCSLRSRRL